MDPQENQAPVSEEQPQAMLESMPEPQPAPASESVQTTPVEAPVPEEVSTEEKAPVSFNWKKPVIWMVVVGVVALGIWLAAGYM